MHMERHGSRRVGEAQGRAVGGEKEQTALIHTECAQPHQHAASASLHLVLPSQVTSGLPVQARRQKRLLMDIVHTSERNTPAEADTRVPTPRHTDLKRDSANGNKRLNNSYLLQ